MTSRPTFPLVALRDGCCKSLAPIAPEPPHGAPVRPWQALAVQAKTNAGLLKPCPKPGAVTWMPDLVSCLRLNRVQTVHKLWSW